MVKNGKGIWLYIDKLNGPRIWYFYKRWPVDLEKQLGRFDRQSLRTADDREAEIRAVECLRIHEAKINAVRGGQPFHDLSKAMSLADLSDDDRYLLEKVINEAEDSDQPINIPVKISQQTSLLLEYNNIQNGKYDDQLMSYFLARNVILSSSSEVYHYALSQLREGL